VDKPWIAPIREVFDEAAGFDWDPHLSRVSDAFRLVDKDRFVTNFVKTPPILFHGMLDALESGNWTLVISLNHQLMNEEDREKPPANFWDFCQTGVGTPNFYTRFYRPLIQVASAIGAEPVEPSETEYARRKMVFVELCPYASQRFRLDPMEFAEFVREDRGCQLQAEVVRVLIDQAQPRVILLNGNQTIEDFGLVYGQEFVRREDGNFWATDRYESAHKPQKFLWHLYGSLETSWGLCPVVAFPFLRTMSSHNANTEIGQLGTRARKHLYGS
jgi:hypothetical protein